MLITIGTRRTQCCEDAELQRAFAARHWVRLPAFLDEPLLRRVVRDLSTSGFTQMHHVALGSDSTDLRLTGEPTSELLVLLCNDPAVLGAIGQMTGCPGITRFNGSIYRMLTDHRQPWHDDLIDGRALALSINVGSSDYDGGVLEIRERRTRRTIARVPNTGPGDAVLFRLDKSLEHRVTPVTRGVKTAFAGWFRRGTPLADELRGAAVLR